MKKTYINKPNSSSYFRIGKALVRIDFDDSGEYTTDNPLWQKAIENSYSFKAGELQLVTPSMTWIKIDRDESGYATEECLELMRKAIPFVFVATKEVYVAVGNESDFNVYEDGFKTDIFDVTHYLPIPKLEV